ncbi:MAG: preprotein translocase subunit SecG [Candidatus Eisenbacteria bacterium]|nr:preprotein translocase subunit SecG [Candidatus Eisenbacteria bacterium]
MYVGLIVFHLLVCLALVGVVLMQSGKGGGLAGGAFGGSAQTVFGGRGATDFFTKATMVLAGMFFLTSVVLGLMSSNRAASTQSVVQKAAKSAAATSPAPVRTGPAGGIPAPAAPAGGGQQAPPAAGGR